MFDGDGMIHGVYFKRRHGRIEPLYVNKFIQTDVFLASGYWGSNLLPSIASLIDPVTSTIGILKSVLRSGAIAFLSGSTRLSTANTALVYHDRRLLATCESGPPMHVGLPELETVDWHTFKDEKTGRALSSVPGSSQEWITGHPKVDPINGDLLMFGYDIFQLRNPYIRFSVLDSQGRHTTFQERVYLQSNTPKMMHDFAITQTRAIILDLPLTMSPFNIVSGTPMLHFDASLTSRFGVLSRSYRTGDTVQWFETPSCMIFHTVNAWDECDNGIVVAVHLVACRFKGAKLVYAAGAIEMPKTGDDVVHLYHYRFDLRTGKTTEHPLSDFPIEYPSINTAFLSLQNRFAYGASMLEGSFDTALTGAKVDVLVKCDIQALIKNPPQGVTDATSITPPKLAGVSSIILPPHHYASEVTFVTNGPGEDDGVVLVHVYNALNNLSNGDAPDNIGSEVWIIDAKTFTLPPICKITLPQRVPYGLHGLWVPESSLHQQRGTTLNENGDVVRTIPGTRQSTSITIITSFWKWSAVWAGKSTLNTVSSGRYAFCLLLAVGIFILLTYRAVWTLSIALQRLAFSKYPPSLV